MAKINYEHVYSLVQSAMSTLSTVCEYLEDLSPRKVGDPLVVTVIPVGELQKGTAFFDYERESFDHPDREETYFSGRVTVELPEGKEVTLERDEFVFCDLIMR